ncbi:hypothetical protein [Antrihabitans sp. YC2-6]|uniref:hypothetical protein n=1 Tax=Antrihabitans sp. YC2-6 TaxID=2799498 RepID=UPI0018F53FAD|nr:hypothetical protein [Antrihabitans sp. YC2-6]MBJ8345874.1 hypothetical protein [Antrihabitans sp. YC2-6]
MITTRNLVRSAVAAAIIGATAVTTVGVANAAPRAPWGEAQEIVDAFPELLPTSPSSLGYHGASCSADTNPSQDSGANVAINCVDSDDVYVDVFAYINPRGIENALATLDLTAPTEATLDDGSYYTYYELANADGGTVVFITFESSTLEDYLMVVSKEGATFDEIAATWGQDAPIGGTSIGM